MCGSVVLEIHKVHGLIRQKLDDFHLLVIDMFVFSKEPRVIWLL